MRNFHAQHTCTDVNGISTNLLTTDTMAPGETRDVRVTAGSVDSPADQQNTTFHFDVPSSAVNTLSLDYPSETGVLAYDTLIGARVTLKDGGGRGMPGQQIAWNGGFDAPSSTTNGSGVATNTFVFRTTTGYAGSDVSKTINITAPGANATTGKRTLHFGTAGNNVLSITAPPQGTTLQFDQWNTLAVSLQNSLGDALDGYEVLWTADSGASLLNGATTTANGGLSTNAIRLAKPSGDIMASVSLTLAVTNGNASTGRTLKFSGAPTGTPTFELVANNLYAHSSTPAGSEVAPRKDNHVVTLLATSLNGDESPRIADVVTWSFSPSVVDRLQVFDRDDGKLAFDDQLDNIVTRTDDKGQAIIKVGATDQYIGHVYASRPGGLVHQLPIAICTVNTRGKPGSELGPLVLPTGTCGLQIPSGGAPFFTATLPTDSPLRKTPGLPVIVWLQGARGEEFIVSTASDSASGAIYIPYSDLDTSGQNTNTIAYATSDNAGNVSQSAMHGIYGDRQSAVGPSGLQQPQPAPRRALVEKPYDYRGL